MRDRYRIEIYQSANVPDGYGGTIPGKTLYWATQGSVKPLKQSRDQESNQTVLKGGYTFRIRYRKDKAPNSSMTIHYDGKILNIHSAVNEKEEYKFWSVIGIHSGEVPVEPLDLALDLTSVEGEGLENNLVYEFTDTEDGQIIEL